MKVIRQESDVWPPRHRRVEVPDDFISGYNEAANVLIDHDKIMDFVEKETSCPPKCVMSNALKQSTFSLVNTKPY